MFYGNVNVLICSKTSSRIEGKGLRGWLNVQKLFFAFTLRFLLNG